MATKKYKVSELAKDLGTTSNDIIECLAKAFEGTKKNSSSLLDEEVNYVLEVYTQKNEVKSFDEYFAAKTKTIKEEPKKEEKKPAAKKAEPKKEEPKKAEPKEQPKA
ncbi:MAG: translation initiation factor IF-2 N-terminal domain-containing protein, partial [Oscillospiraceae bacterium]|nr:translation initiation factor IF-2 N-terminal domain-containing protein [Oscillospiraceae bacterium]